MTAENAMAGYSIYALWSMKSSINGGYPVFKAVISTSTSSGGSSSSHTITVTETSSPLFDRAPGVVKAKANMTSAFSSSVESGSPAPMRTPPASGSESGIRSTP